MLVNVFKLGEEAIITTFTPGVYLLGRGPTLQCNDKRVSRNHASLEVTGEEVKLTSTHVNPCFLKAANSKTITILSKDATTQLNNGDAFAFLPDDFWFRINVVEEGTPNQVAPENGACKRRSPSCEEAPPDKRLKIDELGIEEETGSIKNGNDELSEPNVQAIDLNREETNIDITQENTGQSSDKAAEEIGDSSTKEENEGVSEPVNVEQVSDNQVGDASSSLEQENQDQGPKSPDNTTKNDDGAGTSTTKSRREKCWYGAQCYRKNPVHRQDYTHPGDSDFESDQNDDRPDCPFGVNCYRKNKDHRREYKHPAREPPSKKKRNRKKVQRLNVATSQEMGELDDYDVEDPFINDDESDDYEADSDGDDSDWEADSQDVDEDSQNIKRLVREAKRFTKK